MRKFLLAAAVVATAALLAPPADAQPKGGKGNSKPPGGPSKGKGKAGTEAREKLIAELKKNGVNVNAADVVGIGRDQSGTIVYLAKGNGKPGLKQILKRHGKEFRKRGSEDNDLPEVPINVVRQSEEKANSKKGSVYNSTQRGGPIRVETGPKGNIVEARPTPAKRKPSAGGKKSPAKGQPKRGETAGDR